MQYPQTESKFINSLITDCVTYGLTETQALEYIKHRFKEIGLSAYTKRKAKVLKGGGAQVWLNHFTRVGFVEHHKEQIDRMKAIQDYSMRRFYELSKEDFPNTELILKVQKDIRLSAKLLSELGLGTPIISAIKARIDAVKIKEDQNFGR